MSEFTEQEAAIYDRQLRLWGIEAQKRMVSSNVFVSGLGQLGEEVVKNLVLAGINVTIHDTLLVQPEHVESQFLLEASDMGKNRATAVESKVQALNPLVKLQCVTTPLEKLQDEYFSHFDILCVLGYPNATQQQRLNQLARSRQIPFYAAHAFGMDAILFADLVQHTYRKAKSTDQTLGDPISVSYPSLEEAMSVPWKGLHSSKRRGLKLPQVYVLWNVLWKFQAVHGRIPEASDQAALCQLASELAIEKEIPEDCQAFVDVDSIERLIRCAEAQVVPVCAIMAGILVQEIVKVISRRDEPIHNFFFFNGEEGKGFSRSICPSAP